MEILRKKYILSRAFKLKRFIKKWAAYLYWKCADLADFFYVILRARLFRCLDFCHTVIRFYPKNHRFAKTDFAILSEYWLHPPFSISKRYLQLKLEPDVYQYGETPLRTMEKIAQYAHISKGDCLFELGCGIGRCALWLAYFKECSVVAIEQIPDFVDFSQTLVEKDEFLKEKVSFIKADFLSVDLHRATVVYLYGTKMTDAQIELLILNLRKSPLKTTVITVSYSLNEIIAVSKNYAILKERFLIVKKFEGEFFWGKATVFIQKKL
ncbi:MAG: class I SAM-dependent methyltransferase [Puniceicoccales bacterium]|jgi:predicted RNA methylase|nr:class I SAM-dependent methyltransferase [Puniceicoccales bacterium]